MKQRRKSPLRKLLRQVAAYIGLIGFVAVIFASGFVTGRCTVSSAAKELPEAVNETTPDTDFAAPLVEETIIPEETPVVEELVVEEPWVEFIATAYCPCEKCCGEWATKRPLDDKGKPIVYGAAGIVLQAGVSVAADTSIYPMGTHLEIEGVGTYTVQDRGGAIVGNRIDVYFDNHDDAVVFGRQTVRVREVK